MSETRRVWTPELVKELNTRLADIAVEMRNLVIAEIRVGDILLEALKPIPVEEEEPEADE